MKRVLSRIMGKLDEITDFKRLESYKKLIIGEDYRLGNNVIMAHPENISIGRRSYINGGYLLASPNACIKIGDDCLISYNVHIRTDMHNYRDASIPINKQGYSERDITIEDDVWIGFGVQIMPGVTVKKGSVIGAGGVLTHSTEEYGVYAGVPARKIGERK